MLGNVFGTVLTYTWRYIYSFLFDIALCVGRFLGF